MPTIAASRPVATCNPLHPLALLRSPLRLRAPLPGLATLACVEATRTQTARPPCDPLLPQFCPPHPQSFARPVRATGDREQPALVLDVTFYETAPATAATTSRKPRHPPQLTVNQLNKPARRCPSPANQASDVHAFQNHHPKCIALAGGAPSLPAARPRRIRGDFPSAHALVPNGALHGKRHPALRPVRRCHRRDQRHRLGGDHGGAGPADQGAGGAQRHPRGAAGGPDRHVAPSRRRRSGRWRTRRAGRSAAAG